MCIVLHRKAHLPQIAGATHPSGSFPRRLNRRQQQSNENSDNSNYHQKFHERKSAASHGHALVR
jgi:hypothetical protein